MSKQTTGTIVSELRELIKSKNAGSLTEEEFGLAKKRVLWNLSKQNQRGSAVLQTPGTSIGGGFGPTLGASSQQTSPNSVAKSSDDQKRDMNANFDDVDRNHDGKVVWEEFRDHFSDGHFLEQLSSKYHTVEHAQTEGDAIRKKRRRVLAVVDKKENGHIVDGKGRVSRTFTQILRIVFQCFDTDGNGYLDKAEFDRLRKADPATFIMEMMMQVPIQHPRIVEPGKYSLTFVERAVAMVPRVIAEKAGGTKDGKDDHGNLAIHIDIGQVLSEKDVEDEFKRLLEDHANGTVTEPFRDGTHFKNQWEMVSKDCINDDGMLEMLKFIFNKVRGYTFQGEATGRNILSPKMIWALANRYATLMQEKLDAESE